MGNNYRVGDNPDLPFNKFQGNFNVWSVGESDELTGSLSVSEELRNKMQGTIFQVIATQQSDLSGSLSVSEQLKNKMRGTIFQIRSTQQSDLSGSLSVSEQLKNKMRGTIFQIRATQQSDLSSSIIIAVKQTVSNELKSSISVEHKNELNSSLSVSLKNDLSSSLSISEQLKNKMRGTIFQIRSTQQSDLSGSISISEQLKNKMRGTIFQIRSTQQSDLSSSIAIDVNQTVSNELKSSISVSVEHKNELNSSLSVASKISVGEQLKNKLRGTIFQIRATQQDELIGSIFVNTQNSLPSSIFVKPDNYMEGVADFIALRQSDLPASLQLFVGSELPGTVSIRPYNKMEGIAEIQQPTTIVEKIYPVKDNFVRSGYPKQSFGYNEDMYVGSSNTGEQFRSLVKFSIDILPKDKYIKKATLVFQGLKNTNGFDIQLYSVLKDWPEYSTTWNNQPEFGQLLTSFGAGTQIGEVRVDVRDIVLDWYTGEETNNGLLLKALDETLHNQGTFATKESSSPPYLEIEFFDSTVYSYGNSTLKGSIDVVAIGATNLTGSIEVIARYAEVPLPGSLTVNDPRELAGLVIINKPNLVSSVTVYKYGEGELKGQVMVVQSIDDEHEGTIHVRGDKDKDLKGWIRPIYSSESELNASLDIHLLHDIPGTISVRQANHSTLPSIIDVHVTTSLASSLIVHHTSQLPSNIVVRKDSNKDLIGTITVHCTADLPASLEVRQYGNLNSSIIIRVDEENQLTSSLDVYVFDNFPASLDIHHTRDIKGSIFIKLPMHNDFPATIDVFEWEDLAASLFVLSDNLRGTLTVKQSDTAKLEASIDVRGLEWDKLLSSIQVRVEEKASLPSTLHSRADHSSTLISSIVVTEFNDLESSIDISKKYDLPSSLFIMSTGEDSLESSIIPRPLEANDLDSSLHVGRKNYPYAFIM